MIRRVQIYWHKDVRVRHPEQQGIWKSGGFGVFDAGINALSIATRILPQPLHVRDALLRVPEGCASPVSAEFLLSDTTGLDVVASFNFQGAGTPTWDIEIETDDGRLCLLEGGGRLLRDGKEANLESEGEYTSLYAHFAHLTNSGQIDADLAPLRLAIDALAGGRTEMVPPLHLQFPDDGSFAATDQTDTLRVLIE